MTATDPRPALAARLAPAAEALVAAFVEDANPEPPAPDDRARAECHRAGRAQLADLRQILAPLDWSAAHMPEPEPAGEPPDEASDAPGKPVAELPPAESGYDGSKDEFHHCGEAWVGRLMTPEFRAWDERQSRRTEASIARCLTAPEVRAPTGGKP